MSTPRPTSEETPIEERPERFGTAETHHAAIVETPLAEETDGYVGRIIDDRYRILRVLGEGGMGAVFVAEHMKLKSEVALKVIRPELAGHEELAARFAREAMASARLNHPHVASALDYGTLPEGGAYLVMQLARGQSLSSLIEIHGSLPFALACEIASQIADAAGAAHAIGIVHRDLKPDNVFVEERDDGTILCQVLDFGIARVQNPGETGPEAAAPGRALTTVGTVMGTPGYMAPEQAMGQEADPRADLYALGVMIAEMITGEPLFHGETLAAIVTSQLTQGPPRVAELALARGLPSELESLLRSLVAPEPAMRPAKTTEVRDQLRRIARTSPPATLPSPVPSGPQFSLSGTPSLFQSPAVPPNLGTSTATGRSPLGTLPGLESLSTGRLARLPRSALAGGAVALAIFTFVMLMALMPRSEADENNAADEDAPTTAEPTKRGPSALPAIATPLQPLVESVTRTLVQDEIPRRYAEVVRSEDREVRREAAVFLTEYTPESKVPEVARLAAHLELQRGCRGKKTAIRRLRELGDPSVVPALERAAALPRRGCGFMNTKDCFRCLRGDVARALSELREP